MESSHHSLCPQNQTLCPVSYATIDPARDQTATNIILPPITPSHETVVGERRKTRLASAFFAYFVLGWADGVTGTLLPHFKSDLHLSFVLSSLFWVASASGYALGTITIEHVTRTLGRTCFSTSRVPSAIGLPLHFRTKASDTAEKGSSSLAGYSKSRSRFYIMVLASLLHALFFVIMGCKLGFPSMMVAYVISAFARSFISGSRNVYVPSASKRGFGFLYGSTSVGGFAAPLVCQSIIATGIRWANFYFGSLVLSALNVAFIIYAFWPTKGELEADAELAFKLHRSAGASDAASSVVISTQGSPTSSTAPLKKEDVLGPHSEHTASVSRVFQAYAAALKRLQMWATALFALIYTGSESTTQGFIVVYLLSVRSANPKTVGYVTSGFWGGMALSRFIWGYLGNVISFRQRKWIVQACIFIAFSMHLLILLVPSFVENAVSTAIIGTVYGPIYPANLASARDLLPTEVHLVSLAVIAACASFGAALFPFIAGLLSSTVGAKTLPYIAISQTAAMFCIWFFFPSRAAGRT
ncbi:major facilitator superfamily domain-containing protein [Trametes maxima]|nr:major facilitator superfamily domain-containing protein [Trametes maxima]